MGRGNLLAGKRLGNSEWIGNVVPAPSAVRSWRSMTLTPQNPKANGVASVINPKDAGFMTPALTPAEPLNAFGLRML